MVTDGFGKHIKTVPCCIISKTSFDFIEAYIKGLDERDKELFIKNCPEFNIKHNEEGSDND